MMKNLQITPNFISPEDSQTFSNYITKNKYSSRFDTHTGLAHGRGEATRAIIPEKSDPKLHYELKEIIDKYANLFMDKVSNLYSDESYFYGLSITRLTPGVQLRIHQDIHTSDANLNHSAVMYLNDDWEGGEITFLDEFTPVSRFDIYTDDMNGYVYKPSAGDLYLFPANAWHGGREITAGQRDAIVLWSTSSKDNEFSWSKEYTNFIKDY